MDIIRLTLSGLATNCYIVPTGEFTEVTAANETGEEVTEKLECAVVTDPADNASAILSEARRAGLAVRYILLTHGHYDHTGAAAELKADTGAEIYIHEADNELLSDGVKSLAFFTPERPFKPCEADHFINDGEKLTLGRTVFTVLHTPGHTAGSVCFLFSDTDDDSRKYMLSGDTLFKDSIGRSDVYSSDPLIMTESLDKIAALTDDYIVMPGHGPSTTLSAEKRYNPFIAGF